MNFDVVAPHYDWFEAFSAGNRLQRSRVAWLGKLAGCRRILSVGEGHGRFAEACAARFPGAELTCVEASRGMLARAKARTARSPGAIAWEHADVRQWTPMGTYDAIVSCFFLDCFARDELEQVVRKLATVAAPNAVWLISDFNVPDRGLPRWRAKAVHALMYGFFRAVVGLPARRLTPPDRFLAEHGFSLEGRRESEWGLLRADCWRQRTAKTGLMMTQPEDESRPSAGRTPSVSTVLH
jgi:SAM-dependent methyltransferase